MKKLNKFFAVLVALAMMATLCVSMAFATTAPAAADTNEIGTADSTKIFKYLTVPYGVTVPTATFEIDFTAVSDSSGAAANTMPALGTNNTATITINPNDTTNTKATTYTEDGNSVYSYITVASLLNGVPFDHAGVYTYTAQENQSASSIKNANGTAYNQENGETISLDATTYTIRLTVEKNGSGTYEVTKVTVADASGNKEDLTKTEPVLAEKEGDIEAGTLQGFTFKNVYQKNITNSTDGALQLSKATQKSDATDTTTTLDTTHPFKFVLTLTPALGVDNTATIAATEGGVAKTLNYGTNSIELKAGEKLIIPTLPAGTTYSVLEDLDGSTTVDNYLKYQPSYEVTTVDTDATDAQKADTGKIGEDLETATTYVLTDKSTGDKVAYTNTLDVASTTPTGILISNLPYIALALVAIGGLVAYVVIRRRNADEA